MLHSNKRFLLSWLKVRKQQCACVSHWLMSNVSICCTLYLPIPTLGYLLLGAKFNLSVKVLLVWAFLCTVSKGMGDIAIIWCLDFVSRQLSKHMHTFSIVRHVHTCSIVRHVLRVARWNFKFQVHTSSCVRSQVESSCTWDAVTLCHKSGKSEKWELLCIFWYPKASILNYFKFVLVPSHQ